MKFDRLYIYEINYDRCIYMMRLFYNNSDKLLLLLLLLLLKY